MKIRQVRAGLFHVDGQTDMTKLHGLHASPRMNGNYLVLSKNNGKMYLITMGKRVKFLFKGYVTYGLRKTN